MLSDNIRSYRKKLNLSQDELAEKVGVSRQSVSFWETGQTQPTIDNIIALAKIFNVSTDALLGNSESVDLPQTPQPEYNAAPKKSKTGLIIAICAAAVLVICLIILVVCLMGDRTKPSDPAASGTPDTGRVTVGTEDPNAGNSTTAPTDAPFDLFEYCKALAIEKGELNGDYSIYQQPSTKYGGYEGEYFSIAYWSDSDMVEFCLHCPLDETLSHNFYLRMRGGYNGQYEYTSSKYFRDTGESLRFAAGYIDPAVFSDRYPIPCDTYEGSADGQTQFMEDTRVGICDLINCLKGFVRVEKLECDFSVFDFINF